MLTIAAFVLAAAVAQEPVAPPLSCDLNFRTYSVEILSVKGVTGLVHASMADEAVPCTYWNITWFEPFYPFREITADWHFKFNDRRFIEFDMPKQGFYRVNNYNCDGDPLVVGTLCVGVRNNYNGENPWVWIDKQPNNR